MTLTAALIVDSRDKSERKETRKSWGKSRQEVILAWIGMIPVEKVRRGPVMDIFGRSRQQDLLTKRAWGRKERKR